MTEKFLENAILTNLIINHKYFLDQYIIKTIFAFYLKISEFLHIKVIIY